MLARDDCEVSAAIVEGVPERRVLVRLPMLMVMMVVVVMMMVVVVVVSCIFKIIYRIIQRLIEDCSFDKRKDATWHGKPCSRRDPALPSRIIACTPGQAMNLPFQERRGMLLLKRDLKEVSLRWTCCTLKGNGEGSALDDEKMAPCM